MEFKTLFEINGVKYISAGHLKRTKYNEDSVLLIMIHLPDFLYLCNR